MNYRIKFSERTCGPNTYSDKVEDFLRIMDKIGDNWDDQIAAVATYVKRTSITDYGKKEDLENYYERMSLDTKLRQNVIEYGVITMQTNDGIIWFREENRKYTELLEKIFDGTIIILYNLSPGRYNETPYSPKRIFKEHSELISYFQRYYDEKLPEF